VEKPCLLQAPPPWKYEKVEPMKLEIEDAELSPEQWLGAINALPPVEVIGESKITDPLGSSDFYSARTVVKLLRAERRAALEEAAQEVERMKSYRVAWSHGDITPCIGDATALAASIRAMKRVSTATVEKPSP
jgi:hypothetical protein